jgi:hypothetical protein
VEREQVAFDRLLVAEEPHGTFHDAMLRCLTVNYEEATCVAEFALFVGDPDAGEPADRERTRIGRLCFRDLLYWVCEPPADLPMKPGGAAWVTSDGPLSEAPTDAARKLVLSLPPEAKAWYLYFSDLNAFAYVAALSVEFAWSEGCEHS